ncbi:MAG: hypothetical protein IIC58_08895 [Proteobacteria bacterium]|nr:hypothetical protein [Pseudomonadota bacterium]
MASIPVQFSDTSLSDHLVSARLLSPTRSDQGQLLHSGIESLDRVFARVKPGDLIEWGIPPGLNGRLIPLQFLKRQIPTSVWIYHHHGLGIFASSWISHGVDLQRLFFMRSAQPVKELRPLFLEDTFKRIIIDSPKKFSKGDLAFVSQQARKYRQIVFLIRHYFLSPKQGNPYASLRLNTWQVGRGEFSLQVIKGHGADKFTMSAQQVYTNHE